jgi:porphobilinogen deaminase
MVHSMEDLVQVIPPDLELHNTLSVVQHRYQLVLSQHAKVQRTYAKLQELRKEGTDLSTSSIPAKSPL